MWSLYTLYHFWMRIFSGLVPICAATSFLRSPMVSSSLFVRVGGDGGELGTVRFGRSDRLGFAQGAHRGEKGGAGGHEGVGCVDTHLHLTRIFLPRRSLSTTSIMRAVAYPSGCVEGVAPRMAVSTFRHHFSRNFDGADRQTKFSTVRFGHFERARPSCGPEAPCCSSRCSSGAS